MKRRFLAASMTVLLTAAATGWSEAPYKPIMNVSGVKLAVLEDGKPTGKYRVVELDVHYHAGSTDAVWREVVIVPSYDGERTILMARFYSTEEGTLSDLSVRGHDATFDLEFDSDRKIRILCQKTGPNITSYEITGTTAGHDRPEDGEPRVEWVTVQGILMPSKNVW